jgi:hypothetical protein
MKHGFPTAAAGSSQAPTAAVENPAAVSDQTERKFKAG